MRTRFILLCIFLFGLLLINYYPPTGHLDPGTYNATTLTIADENGTELATVEVRVAETDEQRIIGLSREEDLEAGRGMLFVHSSEDTYEYSMDDMAFSLDIIYIDADGRITDIYHADPGDGAVTGHGQYVLEVPRGWANATGIGPGDYVTIPGPVAVPE